MNETDDNKDPRTQPWEPESQPELDPAAQSETNTPTEFQPDEAEAQTQPEWQAAEVDSKPELEPDEQPQAQPELRSEVQPEEQVETQPEAELPAQLAANPSPAQSVVQPSLEANQTTEPVLKKVHSRLLIITVALGLFLLLAIGCVIYLLVSPPKSTSSTGSTNDTSAKTAAANDSIVKIIDKVRSQIPVNIKSYYPSPVIKDTTVAPLYDAPDGKYAVVSQTIGHGLVIVPDESAVDSVKVVTINPDALNKIGQTIKDVVTSQPGLKATTKHGKQYYENDTIVCDLTNYYTSYSSLFSCAVKSDYNDLIAKTAPFAKAFQESDNKSTEIYGIPVLGEPLITAGGYGYLNAKVAMGDSDSTVGFSSLFYSKNNSWTMLGLTENTGYCSAYNTRARQEAYEYTACYDEATLKNTYVTVTLKQ